MKRQPETIMSELEAERDRVVRAIDILRSGIKPGIQRGRLSAAGRKRISEAAKRRWATWKRKAR